MAGSTVIEAHRRWRKRNRLPLAARAATSTGVTALAAA
jgi:hypothetical protein